MGLERKEQHTGGLPQKGGGSSRGESTGLLSRGSQVRVLSGALFPKEIADFVRKKSPGEHTSNKVISLASSRHISRIS
jgi:hypothetical protein